MTQQGIHGKGEAEHGWPAAGKLSQLYDRLRRDGVLGMVAFGVTMMSAGAALSTNRAVYCVPLVIAVFLMVYWRPKVGDAE